MKRYSFEKMTGIVVTSVVVLLIEGIFFFWIFHKKIELFSMISGVVVDQEVVLYLNESERKNLYANTYFYIDNKSAEEAVISLIEIAKNRNKYNYKLKLAKKRKLIILNTENNIDSKQPASDEEKEINKGNFDDITCIVVFL